MNEKSKIHFLDTYEGGYMREYIDDVASEEGLNLEYRSDFDIAFDEAFNQLKTECPDMDFESISSNKEVLF
tara:strand:- start:131 stop:343 length:213 start_codon:yes stop_codon:yes gene_type:complete